MATDLTGDNSIVGRSGGSMVDFTGLCEVRKWALEEASYGIARQTGKLDPILVPVSGG